MAFHFFTEPNKLQNQTAEQAFGAIDENNYRLGNLFTVSSNAKVFAITSGVVLVQPINTTTVNIVLKPDEQPDLNLPKIDYIIYKGINKASLLDSANPNQVAVASQNNLTEIIWDSHAKLLASEMSDISPVPLAIDALGFGYSAEATDEYKALDEDPLNIAFFNQNNKLSKIESGHHIGNFIDGIIGITIVFEKIGFEPTFKIAREIDSKLEFTALDSAATIAQKFKRKHDKEDVLAFMDSAAFFSAFNGENIKVASTNDTFEEKTEEEFYTEITQKHINKNTLYLDIRNENSDSFNYYENYDNTINLDLLGSDVYLEKDYYNNTWPILTIKEIDFDAANIDKSIGLRLPIGDNEYPQFFLKKGNLLNVTSEELQNPSTRFLDLETNIEETHYTIIDKLQVSKSDTGVIKSNYFQLKYIKRYATPDSSYKGLSLKNESYLDNLFPIFDMKLPFSNEGSVNIKMFTDVSYIDKTNINEIDFTTDIGIATDAQNISFTALPNTYNESEINTRGKVPIYSEKAFNEDTFVRHFNKKAIADKIQKDLFQTENENYPFLSFPSINSELENPETATINNDIVLDPSELPLDTENINILALTREQYSQLETIKNTEFTAPYKVYLGVANTEYLSTDIDSVATTYYVLRGLKENDSGDIITHEYITDIQVFAENDLYNWDEVRVDHTKLNYEEKFHLSSIGIGEYIKEQNPGYPNTTFKYLYETLGVELKNIVEDFNTTINLLIDTNFHDNILSIIIEKGTLLLEKAKENIRLNGNLMYGKDGALYIARLQMIKSLKKHPLSPFVIPFIFEGYLNTLEKVTRGLHVTNLPDFSTHPTHIPILISGYDPFRAAYPNPYSGWDNDFHLSNPSGNIALALDGEEIIIGNKKAIIKAVLFPVRFKEFDNGWIEKFFEPYINPNNSNFDANISTGNPVKMIITFSYGGAEHFKVDRFSARNRKSTNRDNNGKFAGVSLYLQKTDKNNLEFIETTLPYNDLCSVNQVKFHQKAFFKYYSGTLDLHEKREEDVKQLTPLIPFPNLVNYPSNNATANKLISTEGSGGDYLSNEIYYRVAFLRESFNGSLKTGHIHTGFLKKYQDPTTPTRTEMLTIIRQSIKEAIENL